MYICPKCKAVCDKNYEICPGCGEDLSMYDQEELQAGFEPEILYLADNLAEGQAICEFLLDNNIPSMPLDYNSPVSFMTAMRPSSANSIPILVPADKLDQAHKLLEEYLAATPEFINWEEESKVDEDNIDEDNLKLEEDDEEEDE